MSNLNKLSYFSKYWNKKTILIYLAVHVSYLVNYFTAVITWVKNQKNEIWPQGFRQI